MLRDLLVAIVGSFSSESICDQKLDGYIIFWNNLKNDFNQTGGGRLITRNKI